MNHIVGTFPLTKFDDGLKLLHEVDRAEIKSDHSTCKTRGSAIAEEPHDALRQLKYYGRFLLSY